MTAVRDHNPADWRKTLALAWFALALGCVCCAFAVYGGWSEYHNNGVLDGSALVGMSVLGLGFLFRDATNLRTSETRRYVNGVYRGTEFRFDWSDAAGQVRFQITGTDRGSADGQNSWLHLPYQWACAAETAWSLDRLDRLQEDLGRQGSVRYHLKGDGWLAVTPGGLDLHRHGETVHCSAADLEGLSLSEGVFTLRLRDAHEGLFGSSGVHKFGYGEVANVKLFLLTLERLLGLRLSPG